MEKGGGHAATPDRVVSRLRRDAAARAPRGHGAWPSRSRDCCESRARRGPCEPPAAPAAGDQAWPRARGPPFNSLRFAGVLLLGRERARTTRAGEQARASGAPGGPDSFVRRPLLRAALRPLMAAGHGVKLWTGRNLSAAAVFALASVALRRWQASPATESGGYAGRRAVGIGFSGLRGADASAADWRRAAAKELKIARIDLSKKLIAELQRDSDKNGQ